VSPDASAAHLLGRMAVLEARVRHAVFVRRADDPGADDPFRGLYLTEEHVDRILEGTVPLPPSDPQIGTFLADLEARADADEAAGADVRLRRLARSFGLDAVDVELLMAALAPDIDSRFERLYGYLHDDVTRRRATIGLALELCGIVPASAPARQKLNRRGPLVAGGLLAFDDLDRPYLTRSLQVPDRVAAHLLGSDQFDPDLSELLVDVPVEPGDEGEGAAVTRALRSGAELCFLREKPGSSGRAAAVAALDALGGAAVVLDLARLGPDDDPAAMGRTAAREARLRGGVVVAGPLEVLIERGATAVRAFAELPVTVMLIGRCSWDPAWSRDVPVLVEVRPPSAPRRAELWRASMDGHDLDGLDAGEVTRHFRLTPDQVLRAARAAHLQSVVDDAGITADSLRAGARAQNAAGLEILARRVQPAVAWEDLVLPGSTLAGLRELAARARNRDRVIDEWAMRPGGGRGRGITALFAGDSGTGKTMSTEVIAGELGLDLYAINLATVVDKYVGETEKNLERIFSEADGINGVLLFDEADAIFGKRSEVRDAHDRYANMETAYLLQRMESFDGLAILSTNLRANLDDAFARRLDAVIDFPMPDPGQRRHLWDRCLGSALPRHDDVDLDFAARFELSGGNIRSIAITAAYLAAEAQRPVAMADLMRATQREYRKLGRLCVESEFGSWFRLAMS